MLSRRLRLPAYFVGASLVAVPAFDALMQIAPFHPFDPRWRFGAVGLLSGALLLPEIGLLIAVAVAVNSNDHVTQRGLRVLSWIGVVLVAGCLALFVHDATETRVTVRPDLQHEFLAASMTSMFNLAAGAAAFAVLARASNRRVVRKPRLDDEGEAPELIPSRRKRHHLSDA